MKANYAIEAGDVRVIRPLVYCREKMTRDFSLSAQFPVINENCPACFEQPKERARVKKLLAQEESMVPALFNNMKKALVPLMHDDTYNAMQSVLQLVEKNSQFQMHSKNEASDEIKDAGFDEMSENINSVDSCSINGYCPPCFELA